MIKLYGAPRTRSIRVAWLLEELEQEYELIPGEFQPTPEKFFIQNTPTGKFPTIEHDGLVLMESGAIIEYLCEVFQTDLIPPPGTRAKAEVLKWIHYADATAFAPLGIVIWLSLYRNDADQHPELITAARSRATSGLKSVEERLQQHDWLSDDFSAADIMMGFTVLAANLLGLVEAGSPINGYIERLTTRPALQRAANRLGDQI